MLDVPKIQYHLLAIPPPSQELTKGFDWACVADPLKLTIRVRVSSKESKCEVIVGFLS